MPGISFNKGNATRAGSEEGRLFSQARVTLGLTSIPSRGE